MSNYRRTTFYTGVTSNLLQRVLQHRHGEGSVFTRKYRCKYLMYYEYYDSIVGAIEREKQLKNWKRSWKIALIKKENPKMIDLFDDIDPENTNELL